MVLKPRIVIYSSLVFFSAEYSQYNEQGILTNVLGIVLVGLGIVVVYLVSNSNFQRPPMNEEQQPINSSD